MTFIWGFGRYREQLHDSDDDFDDLLAYYDVLEIGDLFDDDEDVASSFEEYKAKLAFKNGIFRYINQYLSSLDENIDSMEYRELFKEAMENSLKYLDEMDDEFLYRLIAGVFGVYPGEICNYVFGNSYVDVTINSKGSYYNFILYALLYAAHSQKDNYENFSEVITDISGFTYLATDFLTWKYEIESEEIKRNKNLIEKIVSNRNYKNNSRLREILILILKDSMSYKEPEIEAFLVSLNVFYKEVDLTETKNDTNVELVLNDLLNTGSYSKILLYGNRYEYLRSVEVEDNLNIKNRIFLDIKSLSSGLFDELNSDRENDYFIWCMNSVFNSDSYHELFSKLKLLTSVSNLYDSGKKKEAFDLLRDLNSHSHKEIYRDKVVSYDGMNRVNKPKRIIDRMKYLYNRIDNSISYDFMDECHSNASGYESMEIEFYNELYKPFNKLKNKVKKFLVKGGKGNGKN